MAKQSDQNAKPIKILFVCLGNICRSPAAEGVMRKISTGLPVEVDSAGTAGYHIGELPDPRMRSHAAKRNYILTHRARQFEPDRDFERFDLILAMDDSNLQNLQKMDKEGRYGHKLKRMTSYSQTMKVKEVPDPYYNGPEGFEHVLDILEDACGGLLKSIQQQ